MGIGETLKKGFSITKESMPLVCVLFIFGATWNLITLFLNKDVDPAVGPSPILMVLSVLFIFISVFMQGGSLGYLKEKIKTGASNFGIFKSSGLKNFLPLLVLGIIIAIIAGLFMLLGIFSVGALQAAGVAIALLLAALGIYLVLLLFLAPYAIVSDGIGPIAALKKSVSMVRQNIKEVLGIVLLLVLIGFGCGLLLGAIFGLIGLVLKGTAAQALVAVGSSFLNAFLGVVVSAAFMSYYLGKTSSS
jgi:hypothetical protein